MHVLLFVWLGWYCNWFSVTSLCRARKQIQRSADGDEDSAPQKQVTPHLPSSPVSDLSARAAVMKTITACCLSFSSASKANSDPRHSPKLPKPQEPPYGKKGHARRQTHRVWVAAPCWLCHNTCTRCFAWGGGVHCVVFLFSCTLSLSHRYVCHWQVCFLVWEAVIKKDAACQPERMKKPFKHPLSLWFILIHSEKANL